ncbi:MAG: hypothetical protein ACLVKO_00885 [Dysgonomonas sp.]
MVEEEKIWVTSWAKMPGMDYHDFLNMSYTEWLKVWLVKYIRYGKLYFLLFCLAGVSPLIVWFIRKKRKICLLF